MLTRDAEADVGAIDGFDGDHAYAKPSKTFLHFLSFLPVIRTSIYLSN